jgi:hypothetical protein
MIPSIMISRVLTLLTLAAVVLPCSALAQNANPSSTPQASQPGSRPTVFIDAQNGFDTALSAAFIKKQVPADVVTQKDGATYTLKSADVYSKAETTGSKVARCLFADCIGIEGMASVSVQLIRNSDHAVVWAYQVRKANSGPAGIQSLSEAIAKHIRNDYFNKQK